MKWPKLCKRATQLNYGVEHIVDLEPKCPMWKYLRVKPAASQRVQQCPSSQDLAEQTVAATDPAQNSVFSEGTNFNDFYVPTPLRMGTSIVRTLRTKIGLFGEDWMHQSAFWVSCVELPIEYSIHCTYYCAYIRNIIFQIVGTVISPGPDKKCLQRSKRVQKIAAVNCNTFYFRL